VVEVVEEVEKAMVVLAAALEAAERLGK